MKRLMFVFIFACSIAFTVHAMEPERITNAIPVETEEVENIWNMFPVDIKAKIFAHLSLEKQEKIHTSCPGILLSTNPKSDVNLSKVFKDSCVYFTQNKSDQMIRKWLFAHMISAARGATEDTAEEEIKKQNREFFIKLFEHVERNKYADVLNMMQYFFPDRSPEDVLCPDLENFLPHMMKVFAGGEEVHTQYMENYALWNEAKKTPFFVFLKCEQPNEVGELLILQNTQWVNDFESWDQLITRDDIEMYQFMISFDELNVNLMDGDGKYTILWHAASAYNDNNDILRMLLERGANPNLGKESPLQGAIEFRNHAAIKLLLHCGADCKLVNREELLSIAMQNSDLDLLSLSVNKGVGVNSQIKKINKRFSLLWHAIYKALETDKAEDHAIVDFLRKHPTFVLDKDDKQCVAHYLEIRENKL